LFYGLVFWYFKGVMAFVHYQQADEMNRMHKGVEREREKMKARKEQQLRVKSSQEEER
jgi:hypothetical protein